MADKSVKGGDKTSSTTGHAMKGTDRSKMPGAVVRKRWKPHAERMPLAHEFSRRLIADADYLTGANDAESLESGRNNWRQIFDLIRSRDQQQYRDSAP